MNLSDAESLFQHLYLMLWRPAGGNLFVAIPAHFRPLVGMNQQPSLDGIGQRTGIARLEERPRQTLTDGLSPTLPGDTQRSASLMRRAFTASS